MSEKQWWTATKAMETMKLSSSQSGWKLAGTDSLPRSRTRNAGQYVPGRTLDVRHSDSESSYSYESVSTRDSWDNLSDCVSDSSGGDNNVIATKKPETSRVLLEVSGLRSALEEHSLCPKCNGKMTAQVNTVCLATTVSLLCRNKSCTYVYHGESPARANIQIREASGLSSQCRERNTDFAVNIIYVLGLISVGDGSLEAARMCGLLSLPRDTTMERRSFPVIEERIGPAIRHLSTQVINENLAEEVRLTNEESAQFDENDTMLWNQSVSPGGPSFTLNKNKYPLLKGSFDMGWQQKGSGHNYNSPSGHALFIGQKTRKPIAMDVKSKLCNFCIAAKKKIAGGISPVRYHACTRNWHGSSGAMEAHACLTMMIHLYDRKNCFMSMICCDDDASTRSMLQWSNADHMRNNNTTRPPLVRITKGKNKGKLKERDDKGMLPAHIPEPLFVADPNHRKKVLTGELYALKNQKKDDRHTMSRMDITRIGKNYGYMMRALPQMDESQYEGAGKAVLEHHFDCHTYCGPWCRRKTLSIAERERTKRYYRCKQLDGKLYVVLQGIVSRFITLDRLREIAHGMDTQVNESFNNTASWYCPKNKVYSGSWSLHNRLAMAVGINTLGYFEYFTRLYKLLGMTMEPAVQYFLRQKDDFRTKRLAVMQKQTHKKMRMEKKFQQLKSDELEARNARAKRVGTYRRGINMDGEGDGTTNSKKKSRKDTVCPHCKKTGHSTTRSKYCLLNPANLNDNTAIDADDADAMDTLEIVQDSGDSESDLGLDQFHDVGTWSDEEDNSATAFI